MCCKVRFLRLLQGKSRVVISQGLGVCCKVGFGFVLTYVAAVCCKVGSGSLLDRS